MRRILLLLAIVLASCTPTGAPASSSESPVQTFPASPAARAIQIPPMDASWHIQYSGEINLDLNVDVYNLDVFETTPETIAQLHSRDVYVMCYFSAGSFEKWRSDADRFPDEVLGNSMEGWPGERWLDIRQIDALSPLMSARLDLAAQKNCDGVDPDNLNGYANESGFSLSAEDQLQFNIWLAEAAHTRSLAIGLKNDVDQIPDLLPYFDWQLNEQCFHYRECDRLLPFIAAGKPVFNIEYELSTEQFCAQANGLGFNSIRKNLDLDEYMESCK